MTQDCSAFDLAPLHDAAVAWWKATVGELAPEEAENLALAVSRCVGQVLLATALAETSGKASYRGAQVDCPACGGRARFVGYRWRWIRTLCGDHRVARAYYHCRACRHGQLPWDGAAGLNERMFSPAVKALVAECCARLTHRESSELLARTLGVPLAVSSQQEIVGEVGGRLRAAQAEQVDACFEQFAEIPAEPQAAETGEHLYVAVDAAKAHTDGSWHDVKCAAIFAGVPPPRSGTPPHSGDRAGRTHYVARQEDAARFGRRLYVAALQRGLAEAKQVVVLGDGADWIWNLSAEHYDDATEILDYYHAAGHIWSLARGLYGDESRQGRRWATERCRDLKEHGPQKLLRSLARRRPPQDPEARNELRLARAYFKTHRHRMDYPGFRAKGLLIGSGPVEAACKIIVGQRLKGAGMRWSQSGADAMLAVRTTLLSGQRQLLARYARPS